jgi:hypothetical protein
VIELEGKKVFVLNGLLAEASEGSADWDGLDQLIQAAKRDPDAVAFGWTAGKWVAAA